MSEMTSRVLQRLIAAGFQARVGGIARSAMTFRS
jgi:hypothetical protein